MKKYSIIFLFLSLEAFTQSPIDKWKSYPIPPIDSLFRYNNSDTNWYVTLRNGKVTAQNKIASWPSPDTLPYKTVIDTNPPFKRRGVQTVKKVSNGYLVGYNRGEWGGDLFWFSNKGDSSYKITSANVVGIIELKSKLFLIEGLAHLSYSGGTINQLEFVDQKWKIVNIKELPSAPEVLTMYNNDLLIVASDDIVTFDGINKMDTLRKEGFWAILYPQSAVIINDILYAGMRSGIYKFNLKTKEEEWLMPE